MAMNRVCALSIVLLGLMAVEATAQSTLAGAAKAADAQRRASAVEPVVLSQPRRTVVESNDLTLALIGQYKAARMAVADVKRADRQLDWRLYKSLKASIGGTMDDFIRIYAGEDAIVGALHSFGFTPVSFGVIETRIRRGRMYSGTLKDSVKAPAGTQVAADAAFVQAHRAAIDDVMQQCFEHELKLRSAHFEEGLATR